MIVLVTFTDPETGQVTVSHGVKASTLENAVLPPEPLSSFQAVVGARGWVPGFSTIE